MSALPCATFAGVFAAVEKSQARYAVIPIENTLHGSVHENYDHLLESTLQIVGETSVRISHQLITMPEVSLRSVRQVFSHPVALNQCRTYFAEHPAVEAVPFYDTAGSVKMLRDSRPERTGAIASVRAASIYGGVIRQKGIEDNRQNFTRFFLLSKQKSRGGSGVVAAGGSAFFKTSLVCSMANEPSALFKALACFALRDIDLTKIESRPLRGKPWEYLFYIDLVGGSTDSTVANALANLQERTEFFKILGTYQPTP